MLYGEWFAALEPIQETHTDEWERRWAWNNVTTASFDSVRGIRDLRLRMNRRTMQLTSYAALLNCELTVTAANFSQRLIRDRIAMAEQTFNTEISDAGPYRKQIDPHVLGPACKAFAGERESR